jgi:hypothetical protein
LFSLEESGLGLLLLFCLCRASQRNHVSSETRGGDVFVDLGSRTKHTP